jgi:HisJ family histidinol phosphate phosphatase
MTDPRIAAIPDVHGHAKGEHRPFTEERPLAYSARMLFLWFYHACRRASPRFLMVADHANYLTFEDPGAVATVRRALKLAQAGDLIGAAETAGVDVPHAQVVSEGLRRGMRFAIGAEMDNDPRSRPDAQNIVDALRPDGIIRSVHFVPIHHPEKGADWPWAFDSEEFRELYESISTETLWELYTVKLFDDLEKLPTHIAGHFYVPATLGRWPSQKTLEPYEDRLLDICHQQGIAVEINTRFLYRDHPEEHKQKYLEANARLIHKAKARGVGLGIGSDAHSPKDQGNAFDVILGVLDDAHINELVFPVGGRLARVALRATREHLEAQAQAGRQPVVPGSSITGYGRAELGLPEEAEPVGAHREGGRATRESGPKKRAADSARTSKRPSPSTPPATSTSRRSADSTSSATKAKAARLDKPGAPEKKKPARPPAAPAVPAPPAAPVKAKKPVVKPPPPVVKKAPVAPKSVAKKASSKSAGGKKVTKKASSKNPVRKKPAAKTAAPRRPAKPKRPAAGPAKKSVKKKKPAAKRR